jgi:hypothetical protein
MPPAKKHDPTQDELPLSSVVAHARFPGRTMLYVFEVADAWQISVRQVRDLIDEGKLHAINIAGKNSTAAKYWRVPVSAYDAFVRENRS